jgi:GntR family transcriptional regulator, transcriptional repressor for pyruvate dehydrogenase complex
MSEPDSSRPAIPVETFPRIALPRAADVVMRALVDRLREGAEADARLPRDTELADHFGVSRTVVRDALDRLRRAGVLEIRRGPGGGVTLRQPTLPASLLTEQSELGQEALLHLLEARRALETASAIGAGERASAADLEDLARIATELTAARDDPDRFIEADVRFHLRIAAASGNGLLASFLSEVFRDLAAVRSAYPRAYGSMAAAEGFQLDTLEALRGRDTEAILASIDRHLAALEEHFLGRSLHHIRQ